jgi:hypothetical protein
LALFIEGHHDDGGAIGAHGLGLSDEFLDAGFHRYGINDGLALHAFKAGFDHREFRRIDHCGHACDVGLGGDKVQKFNHRLLRIEKALVHVDVDDLGARRDLIAGDIERGREIPVLDQFAEFGGARDIGALADVDEGNLVVEHKRLQPGQAQQWRDVRYLPGRNTFHTLGDCPDMCWRRTAAAADDIDKTRLRELAYK